MMRMTISWGAAVLLAMVGVGLLTGCQDPSERLNAPPQGDAAHQHPMQENFVHMHDNAMLADMSMSPVHFIPHRPDLNSIGLRRLERYASLLKIYGGELRYDGDEKQELRTQRMDEIKEFLVASGISEDEVSVEQGTSGGTGMDATLAILIRRETGFGGKVQLPSRGGQASPAAN